MSKNKNQTRSEKAKIIILSIVLAIIAWVAIVWVDNPDITTTVSDLEIRFIGEADLRDRGLVITGKGNIPEISAVIGGKRSDLMDFMDHIYIEVDASEISEAGEYALPGTVSLPSSRLTIEKEKYSDISVTVEKLETKEIEIKVKQTGTVKDKMIESKIENPTVTISGARSELENVAYGLATVDISEIKANSNKSVNYVLMDYNDSLIGKNETIETDTAAVEVQNVIYNLRNLPVVIEISPEVAEDYLIDESKIIVTPSSVDVGALDYNTDTEVKAVLNSVDEDGNAECTLIASDGMYIPDASKTVKVKTELTKKISKKLDLDVLAENAPSSGVHIERISVTVWGEESMLNTDNIKAVVDLDGLDSGTYSLPVRIEGDGISVKETYYADVTIE